MHTHLIYTRHLHADVLWRTFAFRSWNCLQVFALFLIFLNVGYFYFELVVDFVQNLLCLILGSYWILLFFNWIKLLISLVLVTWTIRIGGLGLGWSHILKGKFVVLVPFDDWRLLFVRRDLTEYLWVLSRRRLILHILIPIFIFVMILLCLTIIRVLVGIIKQRIIGLYLVLLSLPTIFQCLMMWA